MLNTHWIAQFLEFPLIRFGATLVTIRTLLNFLIVIILSIFATYIIRRLLGKKVLKRTRIEQGVQYLIVRITGYIVFLLGFLIGLQTLGIDLTSFTVLAGAIGVGVGFGLQNIVNNFVSGVMILSERNIQVGDRIEIGGNLGIVKHIGARSTVLLTQENFVLQMPNAELISKPVIRTRRDESTPMRVTFSLQVPFHLNLEEVKQLFMEVLEKHPAILKSPSPLVFLNNFTELGVEFKLSFSTVKMILNEILLKSEIQFEIARLFKERNIAISFPKRELYLMSPIEIKEKK